MGKKVYTLNYAAYSADDNEVYAECVMVSESEEEIKKALEDDYQITLNEDFDAYEDYQINTTKTDSNFMVADKDGFKMICERICYKEII